MLKMQCKNKSILEQTGIFNLGMATSQGERKFFIQTSYRTGGG